MVPIDQEAVSGYDTAGLEDYNVAHHEIVNADSLCGVLLATDHPDGPLLLPFLQLDELFVLLVVVEGAEADQNHQTYHDRDPLHKAVEAILGQEPRDH